ncbi:MAG TPA: tol-pal system protein YbgF [Usitatibacteraceae bacterium]
MMRWIAVTVAMAFSMNAIAGLFDDEEARKDLKNLRALVEQQNRDNEARLQKLDESIKNIGVIQLLNQIEQLNAEIARLRGQIEVLANQNDQLAKRQKDFYLDIDTRLRKLEGMPADGTVAAPTAGGLGTAILPVAAPTAPPAAKPAVTVASKEQESKAYDVGATLFRRGDFLAAIRAFESFKMDFPASALSPNAQYWIGISYFNLKDFPNARAAQEALLKTFPDSPKVPDALLAIAGVHSEMGDNGSARNTLEDIIARYPGSEAATKARTRLTQLRQPRR